MLRLMAALFCLLALTPAQATEAGWALLRDGGHVIFLRHSFSPGSSDSRGFSLDDCATQRNLSDRGKQQAEKMGALLAAKAAATQRVLSSRYCRCLETARLAFDDDKVEAFDALDLLPEDAARAEAANNAVMQAIRDHSGAGNLVLVTHLENIKALTGVSPREGEVVIVRPEGDGLRVLGRIVF